MALIFAYGSNLDFDQMLRRCPSTYVRGAAVLIDYRLAFVGYSAKWKGAVATVIPDPGKLVAGMIYRVSSGDLKKLDGFEGAPQRYERKPFFVLVLGTEVQIEAEAYTLNRPFGQPSPEYLSAIRRGFREWGFDLKLVKNALRYSARRAPKAGSSDERIAKIIGKANMKPSEVEVLRANYPEFFDAVKIPRRKDR